MLLLGLNMLIYLHLHLQCRRNPVQCTPSCMVSNTCSPVCQGCLLPGHNLTTLTCSTYRTGQKSFSDFIILYPQFRNSDGSIFLASQTVQLEWPTWLGGAKRLQPKTIKLYVTHLQSTHVDTGLPFQGCESLLLQHIIRGIKRYMGE